MLKRTSRQLVVDTIALAAAVFASTRLLPFAIDKLTGTGSSIEGFAQIGAGLGVDPTFFRYFVGLQELLVSLGLAASVFAFLPQLPAVQGLARLGVRLAAPGLGKVPAPGRDGRRHQWSYLHRCRPLGRTGLRRQSGTGHCHGYPPSA